VLATLLAVTASTLSFVHRHVSLYVVAILAAIIELLT
jgi:hypothetical protein